MPRRKLLPAGRRKVLPAGGTLVFAVVTACSNSGSPTATPLPPAATATQVPAPATSAPADATRPPSGDDGAVTPALQFVWSVQDVDRGIKPAIVVDSNGVPSVAYMTEALNGFVKVATLEGSLRFGQTGARNITSLALDSNGNPWIAYSDERALNLAVWDGAQWQTQTVVEAGRRPLGQLVSLKIDSQDQPHIAYFEVTNSAPLEGAVKYAKGTASG